MGAVRFASTSAGPALTDPGNSTQVVSDPKAGGDHVAGYAIIEAADAVNKLLIGHPHLANGGTVGIYEVLDMASPA